VVWAAAKWRDPGFGHEHLKILVPAAHKEFSTLFLKAARAVNFN